MNKNQPLLTAQVVLKRADGTSIISKKQHITSENISNFEVGPDRVAESKSRLEKLGFLISAEGNVSLSITGSPKLFAKIFGIEITGKSDLSETHAPRIPNELTDFVADVYIPPAPELF